jgi:putative restriction endonuclease
MSRRAGKWPTALLGNLQGFPTFDDRWEMHLAGVHRPTQAGICGSQNEGAESIVLNGGYEDDQDGGDVIVYTGHGGNDPPTGQQIANQELTKGNLALARSSEYGQPVRVIRGARNPGPHRPAKGYRYDGLYDIEKFWSERGKSGYTIWRFRLVKRSRSS